MRIGLDSCSDLFEKLRYERRKIDKEWNEYEFFNFVVTAWHLQNDWLRNNREGRPEYAIKKVNCAPAEMKEILNVARDLTNGSKHYKLDRKSELKKVVVQVHPPEIRDWNSFFFGAQRAVSTQSAYYSVNDLVVILSNYFEWVFDDSVQAKNFPFRLKEYIDTCKLESSV